jgi:hypothetical protein
MIIPGTPEIGMPDSPERDRLMALRSLRDCGVIRVQIGKVPRGFIILQREHAMRATAVSGDVLPEGHGETKRTCFWLRNLPPLQPTDIVGGREQRVFYTPQGPERWKIRSRFFPGIAAAMADQWGALGPMPDDEMRLAA